jgi:hypothetical protein
MPRKELLLSTRLAISALVAITLAVTAATISSDSYVFRDGDVTWMFGKGMSAAALGKIQSQYGHVFLWARRGGHTYVIRDAAVMEQARAAIAPRLTRPEQEQRLLRVIDSAIQGGKGQVVD